MFSMIFILIILLLVLNEPGIDVLSADELVRISTDETRETRGLFRLWDDEACSELELLRSEEGEWEPVVIFLDTPRYQAGSMTPAGLWKFSGMSSLQTENELSRDTGLDADRSDTSLERPAMALMFPDRAGLLFKQEEELRFTALWGTFRFSPYMSLELGESLLLPEEPEPDDSWFPGEKTESSDPLYITAGNLCWERRRSTLRLRFATAIGPYRMPSYSALPVWRFYFQSGEIMSRLWYCSESWRGSRLKPPEWQWLCDNNLTLRLPCQLLLEGSAAGGVEREGGYGANYGLSAEFSPRAFEIGIDMEYEESCVKKSRTEDYGAHIRFYHGFWRESLNGKLNYRKEVLKGWILKPEIRRSPRSGRYDKLSCSWEAEPGLLTVTPAMESSINLGKIRIQCSLSYELLYSEEPISVDTPDPLSFRISGEWKGR